MPSATKDTHMTKPKTTKTPIKAAAKPKTRRSAQPNLKAENKTDKLIGLLKRESGATIVDITDATRWLPHTARAMLTGLRKKGFTIGKTKVDGATRYAVTAEPAA